MAALKEVLAQALVEVTPDSKTVLKEVNATLKKLNSILAKHNIKAKAVTGGSISKGTFLHNDYDCDIFVKFDRKEYSKKNISDILEKPVNGVFSKVQRIHGSRDYYQSQNGLNYEIIPVLNITKPEQAENITDCSPLHSTWVTRFPEMRKEIMLAKAFTKSAGAYGAESYKKGFSGHVIDILTIHYGGFLKLLKASAKWKPGMVIDHYKTHKGKALFNLNRSKTQSALIVIDPIEPNRNASAALDTEKLESFREYATKFLKDPSIEFFVKKHVTLADLKKRAKHDILIILEVKAKTGKQDVVGAKLLKAVEYISRLLKEKEFVVKEYGWSWPGQQNALFWFIIDKNPLSRATTILGPPVSMNKHVQNFKNKYKKTKIQKGKIVALIDREYTRPGLFLKQGLKDPYLTDKVNTIHMQEI